MEIERKYKIECLNDLPENYRAFPCHAIEQAYLCTDPWCVCAGRTIPIISPTKEKDSLQGKNIIFLSQRSPMNIF